MLIFDFFSGTGSSTQAFADAGHTVISFELDTYFEATHHVDMFEVTSEWLLNTYGTPDFIWASPPCTAFSVASMGYHWTGGKGARIPKTEKAMRSQELVAHIRKVIEELNPKYGYLIENPRGMLRKLDVVAGLPQTTITYCQYGDSRMKPTDLWGHVDNWEPRPMCKNGSPCHESAPRGSRTGTQGLTNAKDRSRVPHALSEDILQAITKDA